jgi:hypothetical protein
MDEQKLIKMLRLAVDPRTPEAEAMTALAILRKNVSEWSEVKVALLNHSIQEYEESRARKFSHEHGAIQRMEVQKNFRDARFHFGKHEGLWISEVARKNFGYILWLLDSCDRLSPPFRRKLEEIVTIYGGGPPADFQPVQEEPSPVSPPPRRRYGCR